MMSANLFLPMWQTQLPSLSDQTVPALTYTYSPPHQETEPGEIYQALDQSEKVLVEKIYDPSGPENVADSLAARLDMLEQVGDYQDFLSENKLADGVSVTHDRHCLRADDPVYSGNDTNSRQCTEESDGNSLKLKSDQNNNAELFEDLDRIMSGEETIEVQQTAAEIFRKIEKFGQSDECSMDSHSDCCTEGGILSDSQTSGGSQSSWEHRATDDEDLLMICANLDSKNIPMQSYLPDLLTVVTDMDENTGVYENSLERGETILPKFPVLLGEQFRTKGDPSAMQDCLRSPRPSLARRTRKTSSVVDDDCISDTSFEDDDDHSIQAHKKQKPTQDADPVYSAAKRSRRRSPKLWMFILDALCDPKLNPSIIRWENKQRGLFKIENTKQLSDLWGCRTGKTVKPGSRHHMTYEKFSRAMRYYYKDRVLSSVPGRLTYQFGPNATGWRAKAHSAGDAWSNDRM